MGKKECWRELRLKVKVHQKSGNLSKRLTTESNNSGQGEIFIPTKVKCESSKVFPKTVVKMVVVVIECKKSGEGERYHKVCKKRGEKEKEKSDGANTK